jgi:hypothetical protein
MIIDNNIISYIFHLFLSTHIYKKFVNNNILITII